MPRYSWLVPALLVLAAATCFLLPRPTAAAPTTAPATTTAPSVPAALANVLIKDVPHITQKPDFCGEACVEMYSRKLGHPITQDQVFNASGLDPALARGCYARDLNAALLALGFKPGPGWYPLGTKPADEIQAQFRALYADLAKGIPSIVCMHYSDTPDTTEHFRLVLGYDAAKQEVIYHEPAEEGPAAAYKHMPLSQFLKLWPLGTPGTTVIRFRLAFDKLNAPPAAAGFTNADYAQHIMTLKTKMPKGFVFLIQRPFVVVGNDPLPRVAQYATGTVKWAVDHLKQDYFSKEPADILDIWLFNDAASFNKYTREIFHDAPDTPYGYYSDADKALIMNISTGGGTLVHEIVHPFMHTNFPECPPWFNEGMGSLYEQSPPNAMATSSASPTGASPASKKPSRPTPYPPSKPSAPWTATPSTTKTAAPTTANPATSATTSRNTASSTSSTNSSPPTKRKTPPASTPSKKSSPKTTWTPSKEPGKSGS